MSQLDPQKVSVGRVFKQADFQKMPWKNGQGMSYEIAIDPVGSDRTENAFAWRLSTAEIIKGGGFSLYPDYERYLGLVKGESLQLDFEPSKRRVLLKLGKACRFSGSDSVTSTVTQGPVQDLNLIYSASHVRPVFEPIVLQSKPRSFGLRGTRGFIYCIEERVKVSVFPGESQFKLAPGEVLDLDRSQEPGSQESLVLIEPHTPGSSCKLILIELNVQF